MRPFRVRQLHYCGVCKNTTEHVRVSDRDNWKCCKCEKEKVETQVTKRAVNFDNGMDAT